jgi:hypothetical protein
MGIFRKMGALFSAGPRTAGRYLPIYVYSQRCAEAIVGQIDLMNELSAADEGEGAWFVRKVLHTSGQSRCFDQVEASIWLDAAKRITRHEVVNGMWLEPDEYERLKRATASTLEDDYPRGEVAAPNPMGSEDSGGTLNAE